jgi:hypothetical protein
VDTRATKSNKQARASAAGSRAAESRANRHCGPEKSRDAVGSWLLVPLRWLRRKLSGAVRWVAKLLRAPLRATIRIPLWLLTRLPFRGLVGALMRPRGKRGFGFWWLVATVAIAGAVGLIVGALVTPLAGILAFVAVGIWSMVCRVSGRRAEAKLHEQPGKAGRSVGAFETAERASGHGAPIATAPATA